MAPPPVPTAGFCPITPILLASFLSLPHFSLPDLPFTGSHLPTQLLALKSSSRWGTSPKYQHRVRSATHSKSRRSIEQVLGPSHGGFKEQKAHREKREQKVPEKVDGTGPLGGGAGWNRQTAAVEMEFPAEGRTGAKEAGNRATNQEGNEEALNDTS